MSWMLICNNEAISSQLTFSYRQVEKLPEAGLKPQKIGNLHFKISGRRNLVFSFQNRLYSL